MKPLLLLAPLALGLVGCDNTGDEYRPQVTDVPSIVDLGELDVIPADVWSAEGFDIRQYATYTQLGADENPGKQGGATFEFAGTGGAVCVVMDPEATYWNVAKGVDATRAYKYEDNYADDADLDMDIGLTAYYSGSPGVEIGDFNAIYSDPSGQDHTLEFNECLQPGAYQPYVHSGRGTPENCAINTDERAGIMFTGVVKTFALPIEDSIANYAVAAFELPASAGRDGCAAVKLVNDGIRYDLSECTLPSEANLGEGGDAFSELEAAFCSGPGKVNEYCEAHLGDENPLCHEPSN